MTSFATTVKNRPAAEFNIPVELDLHEPECKNVRAEIRRVTTGFFQLWTPVYVQRESKLDIIFDSQRIEVEVVYCKSEKEPGYLAGVRLTYGLDGAIRREPRMPLDVPARVSTPSSSTPLQARITDMSRSGLGLKLPASIPVGIGVSVEIDAGIAFGEIRHCSQTGPNAWKAGLWLEEFLARGDSAKGRERGVEAHKIPLLGGLKRLLGAS